MPSSCRVDGWGSLPPRCHLMAVFAASGAPVPPIERYLAADGLTTGDLSIAAVFYFVAVMLALVVFGRTHAVSIIAVILAAAGCLSLLDVTSLVVLVPGRILQGLSCGLGSSAVVAYIIDLAPKRPRWLAATTAAVAPLIGLTIVAVGSGALAEYGPAPEQTPYLAATLLLAVCAVLLLASPEAIMRRPGALSSMRPHMHLPQAIRPVIFMGADSFPRSNGVGA
ncbi:MFS transporter [Arthrobacter sp. OAP107]|uniref:MFS transporter n=1 Tax=Arthrobacter sp. OAP107 TaxID=3156445 RepID=UPI0033992AF0